MLTKESNGFYTCVSTLWGTDQGLQWRDAFLTYDWQKAIPDPEGTIEDVRELMSLVEA